MKLTSCIWGLSQRGRSAVAAIFCLLAVGISGCGGGGMSQADMMRMAIDRGDDSNDEDQAATPAASVPEPAVAEKSRPIAQPADRVANETTAPNGGSSASEARPPATKPVGNAVAANSVGDNSPPGSDSMVEPVGSSTAESLAVSPESLAESTKGLAESTKSGSELLSIGLRKPASPLSEGDVRARSVSNMEEITVALLAWSNSNYRVPVTVLKDSRGRPGLSWRVAILPFLGYEELYKKFNLSEPWDGPTNKPLLELIPDVFVSPDRFDVNTNYQLFVNGPALFSESEEKEKSEISDAPLIVLMGEVDDALAVPWTAPFDYDIKKTELGTGLGGLRSDGTFVSWFDGKVSLWPNPTRPGLLYRAITFEAGDGLNFTEFRDFPATVPGRDDRPSLGGPLAAVGSSGESAGPGQPVPDRQTSSGLNHFAENEMAMVRSALPSSEAILAAESKVRETYGGMFESARTHIELARLAETMRTQMKEAPLSPAEAFVVLRTAMNVAVRARDPRLAIELLEELDARFRINREEMEMMVLRGFLGDKGTLRKDLAKAVVLVPMLEACVSRLIDQDDFRGAEKVIDYGDSVQRSVGNRETQFRWRLLSERVDEGKRRLPQVAKYIERLASNPNDPEANYRVGWYMCIIKDSWREGAELLAKSDDETLRSLAQMEVQNDSSINRHIRLADAWWEYAEEKEDDGLVFEAALRRARKWYLSAAVGLAGGLDRIRANNRLERIDRMIGKAPDLGDTSKIR